jgi:hypothetical protein
MINTPALIARHLRGVHVGKNYTGANLKDIIEDVSLREANTKIDSLNTIGALVFHINYYTNIVLKVMEGGPLEGHDKFSYDAPELKTQEDWENRIKKELD